MNIDPRGLDVVQWTEFTSLQLSGLTYVPRLLDPKNWRAWAFTVIQSPKVQAHAPPDPRYFDEWGEWATRFNQAVPL